MPSLILRFRRYVCSACLLFSLTVPFVQSAAAQNASPSKTIPTAKEFWLGMYLGGKKAGYTSVQITPTVVNGKSLTETTTRSSLKIEMFGANVEQKAFQRTLSDAQSRPLTQSFDVSSNGSNLHVEARYDYDQNKIFCTLGNAPDLTKKTLIIPKGANLAGDTTIVTEGQKLAVGQKFTYYYLEPLTVALDQAQVAITGRETVTDAATGKPVSAFVVKTSLPQGDMTYWAVDSDSFVKGEMSLGPIKIVMQSEPKARALNLGDNALVTAADSKPAYTPPADFAVATAVVSDKTISDPRRVRSLTVTISGIPNEKLIINDSRQIVASSAKSEDGSSTAQMLIEAKHFYAAQSAKFPFSKPELNPYLEKASFLDTDNVSIKETAAKLRGSESSLYRVASNIRDWVSRSMTPDASIGVPRSATDIYKRRRGVCRDYATLYTAIARAAGVPTRLCSGIVYAEGRFFYHAWAESYVGEWIAFDPTLYDPKKPVDFVDATHIKFAQGDVLQMFDVVTVVGKLRLTVQNYTF